MNATGRSCDSPDHLAGVAEGGLALRLGTGSRWPLSAPCFLHWCVSVRHPSLAINVEVEDLVVLGMGFVIGRILHDLPLLSQRRRAIHHLLAGLLKDRLLRALQGLLQPVLLFLRLLSESIFSNSFPAISFFLPFQAHHELFILLVCFVQALDELFDSRLDGSQHLQGVGLLLIPCQLAALVDVVHLHGQVKEFLVLCRGAGLFRMTLAEFLPPTLLLLDALLQLFDLILQLLNLLAHVRLHGLKIVEHLVLLLLSGLRALDQEEVQLLELREAVHQLLGLLEKELRLLLRRHLLILRIDLSLFFLSLLLDALLSKIPFSLLLQQLFLVFPAPGFLALFPQHFGLSLFLRKLLRDPFLFDRQLLQDGS
eukprot:Skav210362  [mRNA]  locus=scaffold1357:73835:86612:- [translate_table: standard]